MSRGHKKTTAEFIEEAKKKHGDECVYDKVDYKNTHMKVIITCRTHGDFEQTPKHHLSGKYACTKCGHIITSNKNTKNNDKFIEEADNKHNGVYLYKNTNYISAHKKVIITCRTHGDFEQIPHSHLSGRGCPSCGNIQTGITKTDSNDQFLEKAIKKHGDKFVYSKVDYKNTRTNIIITCRIHGDFEQKPYHHLRCEIGCPKCRNELRCGGYTFEYLNNYPKMKDAPAYTYLIQLDNPSESFYKIGISRSLSKRMSKINRESKSYITPIIQFDTTLQNAISIEQEILLLYPSHKPSIKFGGSTECLTLTESDIKEIQSIIINT